MRPQWDTPIVVISSNRAYYHWSIEVGEAHMRTLGQATCRAIERLGRRALLLASNSLSHRHFTDEPPVPEDMSYEHIYHHGQYLWDMHVLGLMRDGRIRALIDQMPEFIEQSVSECREGSLSWLMAALDYPDYPADVHAYGTVIGTGNAIVSWDPARRTP